MTIIKDTGPPPDSLGGDHEISRLASPYRRSDDLVFGSGVRGESMSIHRQRQTGSEASGTLPGTERQAGATATEAERALPGTERPSDPLQARGSLSSTERPASTDAAVILVIDALSDQRPDDRPLDASELEVAEKLMRQISTSAATKR